MTIVTKRVTYPLKVGSPEAAVSLLQAALNSLEELQIQIPASEKGKFGLKTREALNRFRQVFGLKTEGDFGQLDAEYLNGLIQDRQLELKLSTQGEKLDSVKGQTDGLKDTLASHSTSLTAIKGQTDGLKAQGEKLDAVKGQTDGLKNTLAGHSSDLTTIRGQTDGLKGALEGQGDALGRIEGVQVAHGNRLNGLEGKLDGLSAQTIIVPLDLNAHGDEVKTLQEALAELGFVVPASEVNGRLFGAGTRDALLRVQKNYGLKTTGIFDEATRAALGRAVAGAKGRSVSGRVVLDNGLPGKNVVLHLYIHAFGKDPTKFKSETTDANGFYDFTYSDDDKITSLEVKAVAPDGKEYSLSAPKYRVPRHLQLNLVAPVAVLPHEVAVDTEFERLETDLKSHVGNDLAKLADAQEGDVRQDLSFLHKASGWDARLIAVAATAKKLSTESGIAHGAAYALLRTGLPAEPHQFALVGATAVEKALRRAVKAKLLKLDDAQRTAAVNSYRVFAGKTLLAYKPLGAVSTIDDCLNGMGLGDKKNAFADLCFDHRGAADDFWQQAETKVGLTKIQVARLKLQGKFAFLTQNNAALTVSLQNEFANLAEMGQKMVAQGLHEAKNWKERLQTLAANNNTPLENLLPGGLPGKTTEERLTVYAEDLARKVRLSFPTRVVARLVETDKVSLGSNHAQVKGYVQKLLGNAEAKGLRLGELPFAKLRTAGDLHTALFAGVPPAEREKTLMAAARLQRLYQITPTDDALQRVSSLGFDSAAEIAAYPAKTFRRRYGHRFASKNEAALVHRKAQQVTAVTHGLVAMAKQLQASPAFPALPVLAAPEKRRRTAMKRLSERFPSMDRLLGSLDFCECEHCRSVLSPAAYLVDLLQMLEGGSDGAWKARMADWKMRHGDFPYPFRSKTDQDRFNGEWTLRFPTKPVPAPEQTPFAVFDQRRPDIANLPLTCENTNTALPYVDLVNEILEYYVAYDTLADQNGVKSAHDTGLATTPELLAEPQHVEPNAYNTLADERFPLTLPFNLWLETTRQFLGHFDSSLASILELFRKTDALHADPNPEKKEPYGRAEVFTETLGFSPKDVGILTNKAPLADWWVLYGEENSATALQRLTSAKALSDALNITYKTLKDILETGFVNPELATLVPLRKLGAEVSEVVRYEELLAKAARTTEEQAEVDSFKKRLAELTLQFNPAGAAAGFDAEKWLDQAWKGGKFAAILVLRTPKAGCGFDETEVAHADRSDLKPIELVAINLFVRLWKKLGWTIDETSRALEVFTPKSCRPLRADTLGPGLESALYCLAHLNTLANQLSLGKGGHEKLLALWSNVPTTGKDPLYAQLFLRPSALKTDPVFDDPLGKYLETPGPLVKDHMLALQGALNLTTDEIGRILIDAGSSLDVAKLTLDNVSRLYRYGLFARALELTVRELIALKSLAGAEHDPFTTLEEDPITSIDKDYPFTRTLWFVDVVEKVGESAFSIEDLEYLLCHRVIDPVGKYRADPLQVVGLVRTLAAGIGRIRDDHPVLAGADAENLTDERLRQELGLVLPDDAVRKFFGMWNAVTEPGATAPDTLSFYNTYPLGFASKAELDKLLAPIAATEPPDKQHKLKQERRKALAAAFLPFLQKKLAQQFIVDTLSRTFAAAPALVELLLAHLRLPGKDGNPGPLLREVFAAAADPVADNPVPGEGYFEVPTAGLYQFTARLGKANVEVALHIDDAADAVLRGKVAEAGKEITGDPVALKPGAPYRFRLKFAPENPGDGTVTSLEIHGENMPTMALTKLALCSQTSFDQMRRARVLVLKSLQLLQGFRLGEREVRYILEHPSDFDGINFSGLPSVEDDPAAATPTKLFEQFLTLADYARLKREIAGDGDDLIRLFEQVDANNLDEAYKVLAALTRRPLDMVKTLAQSVGLAGGQPSLFKSFNRDAGLGRLWGALQLVQKLGVPADSLIRWATPVPDEAVARDIRDTVKARYDIETWRRVAQPIFDKLRQRKRDALVAFLLRRLRLERVEQLYEHFLIDPGMEPVVQTSRLRLAISSVQLFIQRSLLNLEPQVAPSAIDAGHWQWMKRYRVWEANRKIFLFPENWLEPEFRDDRTNLFQELEGALLQGDISNDLAEDAFFQYLTRLDALARLQIVTTYCEDKPEDPDSTVLHVVGRTYNEPHKYFYRRLAHGMWTPWEPVAADIEGDHIVAVVWRQRLNLFWLTFLDKGENQTDEATTLETGMKVGNLKPWRVVELQLNWSEFCQGQWTQRTSSGFSEPIRQAVPDDFTPSRVFVHVSKEWEGEEERGVKINCHFQAALVIVRELKPVPQTGVTDIWGVTRQPMPFGDSAWSFPHFSSAASGVEWSEEPATRFATTVEIMPVDHAFHVISKNSPPRATTGQAPRVPPFELASGPFARATRQAGSGQLRVVLQDRIVTVDGTVTSGPPTPRPVLSQVGGFELVFSGNHLTPSSDADLLQTPFFFQNDWHTFFVEPVRTEITFEQWERSVPTPPRLDARLEDESWWDKLPLTANMPVGKRVDLIDPIDAGGKVGFDAGNDWLTNPSILLKFGESVIGQNGRVTVHHEKEV